MKLFSDIELFTTGNRGKVIYDLPDAEIMLIDNFYSKEQSDIYYQQFLNNIPWQEYQMAMYDKTVTAPRMISWFQALDNNLPSSIENGPSELQTIQLHIEKETNIHFDAVLLNLYRDGSDSVAWHSDKTKSTNKNMIIASVTFGDTRVFKLRHKFLKDQPIVEIPLNHGTFLLLSGTTNSYWEHQVPKTSKDVLPRINLTFRQLYKNLPNRNSILLK